MQLTTDFAVLEPSFDRTLIYYCSLCGLARIAPRLRAIFIVGWLKLKYNS